MGGETGDRRALRKASKCSAQVDPHILPAAVSPPPCGQERSGRWAVYVTHSDPRTSHPLTYAGSQTNQPSRTHTGFLFPLHTRASHRVPLQQHSNKPSPKTVSVNVIFQL